MADKKLTLDIVTPYGHVFTGEVDEVIAHGSEGEFGVLPDHIPFLTTLKVGMLAYKNGSETGYFFVNWGYAEVGMDKVTILADSAEKAEDIDVERAKEAKRRAEEKLRHEQMMEDAQEAAALERAIARIQIAEKHQIR
ncbi:MAG: F0F1 ATP synthase subunit epsilon [Nitrospirae bacterium]|nr:F0F1 ATP synthase subunit epsilon [Nitrospirota bacterium]